MNQWNIVSQCVTMGLIATNCNHAGSFGSLAIYSMNPKWKTIRNNLKYFKTSENTPGERGNTGSYMKI